jgi:putative NIF3 family GTP cyclohydrolase 1 type 2
MHNELLARPIQSVAICGGAGDFLLDEALNAQADAFLTGEMHYHQYFGHDGQIQIGVLGHYQSEQYTIDIFNSIIGEKCPRLPLFKTTICTNPIKYL